MTYRYVFVSMLCLWLVWASDAQAATCRFVLEPPSIWTDGHPAQLADIAAYWLYTAPCQGCFSEAPVAVFAVDNVGDPARPVLTLSRCSKRRWWRVSAIDQDGNEGLRSPPLFIKR